MEKMKWSRVPGADMGDEAPKKQQVNPYENANPISFFTFWWTLPLFSQAKKKETFELEDLYQTLKEDEAILLGDRLEKHWNSEVLKAERNGTQPRLLRALLLTFWREFFLTGFIVMLNDPILRIIQPILLGRLLLYFRSGPIKDDGPAVVSFLEAWLLASGMLGVIACTVFLLNHYAIHCFHNGMKMKVAACSLIFRKALRLSRTALGETATGQIVNLLANDVSRFDMVAYFLHMMWVSPAICVIVSILVVYELGPSGLFGVAVVLIVCPLQSWTGSLTSKFRRQTAFRTDIRVRLMDEIISGIQAIKMYAWEKPFGKLISKCRSEELSWVRKSSYIRGIYMTFNMFTTRMALFATLLAYALSGHHLAAESVFVVSSYFSVLAWTMSGVFVRGVAELAETWVSAKRIQTFLLRSEFEGRPGALPYTMNSKIPFNHHSISEDKEVVKNNKPIITVTNFDAKVNGVKKDLEEIEDARESEESEVEEILQQNGDLTSDAVAPGTLIVENAVASWVIGAEPTLNQLTFRVEPGSLVAVIGAVGSGKSSLIQALLGELPLTSGKAIVAARAVSYSSQEPWIFSGSLRENILFGRPFERRRYNQVVKACCLLPDIKRMANGDQTLVGERGGSLSGGQKARVTLARAAYRSDVDAYLLDEPLSALDVNVARHVYEDCIEGLLRGTTRVLVTHQLHLLRRADLVVLINNGKVAAKGTYDQLMSNAEGFTKLLESGDEAEQGEPPLKSLLRQISSSSQQSLQAAKEEEEQEAETPPPAIAVEKSKQGSVSKSVYTQYWRLGASPLILVFMATMFILAQVAASGADFWVAYWTTVEQKRYDLNHQANNTNASQPLQDVVEEEELMSLEWCVIIYSIILVILFASAIIRSLLHYVVSISSSQNLHDKMFKSIVAAPMYFFSWNPAGRILNRFSRDMGSVDELLPKAILDTAQFMMMMVGAVVVTAIVNPLFLVPVFFLSIIFHIVRKNYLLTSRRIKRLEGAARSPVFSLLADVLQDLPTVRALNAEQMLKLRVEGFQDTHSSAWFMLISASTAFGFALDIMCLIFISVVTCAFLAVTPEGRGAESSVGLAITQAMMLTGMLQWGVRQSAEVENHMTAVERCLEYTTLDQEPQPKKSEVVAIPKDWPSIGRIHFAKTCLRYIPDQPFVLKELTLKIEPTFKVGIVGRTGAGKSSLINALFRMAPLEGQVLIDGLDTGKIQLADLRTNISIIPQDPVLFSGTLRYNLDPFEEYPDFQLWKALEDVELKEAVVEQAGLESLVSAGGTNWSVGQRQLLCLARTILRRNKVLVLDEATANVDPQTDALIQATIRRQFKDCTVLTVAHRLHTIMDSDRVLVMADGSLVEFGAPHELLQIEGGLFQQMVEDTGRATAVTLSKIAEEAFQKNEK